MNFSFFIIFLLGGVLTHNAKGSTLKGRENDPFKTQTNDVDDFVINSRVAQNGNFPFIVSLQVNRKNNNTNPPYTKFCSGTVIDEKWILTAAHCITGVKQYFDQFYINAGTNIAMNYNKPAQLVKVKKTILHPKYDDSNLLNDIGLLKLETPLEFNQNVNPISLPENDLTFDGKNSTLFQVAGWGISVETNINNINKTSTSQILKYGNVPVYSFEECKNLKGYSDNISFQNFCVGEFNGSSTCVGDSGGPLIYRPNQDETYVIGVCSKGLKYCESKPSIFMNILYYLNWINETMDAY